jgi:hypothetical protein
MMLVLIFVLLCMFIYHFGHLGPRQAPAEPAADQARPAEGETSDKAPKPAADATAALEPSGPTDLDRDEQDDIDVEASFIEDGKLHVGKVENLAYQRVLKWVNNQSVAALRKRARSDVLFDRYVSDTKKMRFQIVKVDLVVRHVIKCDQKGPGGDELYEIRGFTPGSRLLYFGMVEGLPEGMPVGTDLSNQAQLVGYFFKLQGYYSEETKTKTPSRAPLIIGRLAWDSPALADTTPDWVWAALAIGVVVVVGGVVAIVAILARRRPLSAQLPHLSRGTDVPAVNDWLDQAESGDLDAGNNSAANGESRAGNGQPDIADTDDSHPPRFPGGFDRIGR